MLSRERFVGQCFNEPRFALELIANDLLDFMHLASSVEFLVKDQRLLSLLLNKLCHLCHQMPLIIL